MPDAATAPAAAPVTSPAADGLRRLTHADVRATLGEPNDIVQSKLLTALDAHCRAFIERSPFLTVATLGAAGDADVSPRGDPSGFVRILDERTLVIPERPGNRLADTLRNVADTGVIALLFLIPGVGETLRVNGHAFVTDDAALLATLEANGKVPKLAIVVEVQEAFLHCAKAFIRSQLWDTGAHAAPGEVPTLGAMIRDQLALEQSVSELEEIIETSYRETLY
jgi:PPOX class probable FMN-dependent enzyme